MMKSDGELMTVHEVARVLSVSPDTVRNMVKRHQFPNPTHEGARRRQLWTSAVVKSWIKEHSTEQEEEEARLADRVAAMRKELDDVRNQLRNMTVTETLAAHGIRLERLTEEVKDLQVKFTTARSSTMHLINEDRQKVEDLEKRFTALGAEIHNALIVVSDQIEGARHVRDPGDRLAREIFSSAGWDIASIERHRKAITGALRNLRELAK